VSDEVVAHLARLAQLVERPPVTVKRPFSPRIGQKTHKLAECRFLSTSSRRTISRFDDSRYSFEVRRIPAQHKKGQVSDLAKLPKNHFR